MRKIESISGVVIIAAIFSLAGLAFANGGGMMGGGMMGNGNGYGYGMMGQGDGPNMGNFGYAGDHSQKVADRLQQARDNFFADTHQLRIDIREKQAVLNDELRKSDPDRTTVTQLQKDISQLQSEYDQKAAAYQLETRRISPDAGDGRGSGLGDGYSRP